VADVRKSADTANARLADVNNDVTGVKTDLASTKTDLAQTKSDLKQVRGDLGSTSSLVATNGKEIDELIRRGERNIIKFNISKNNKGFQKVGDISLELKKVDLKKNKFTLDVNADDKLTEKKDRNINEPLQFYVSSSLYELVVNTVGKDSVPDIFRRRSIRRGITKKGQAEPPVPPLLTTFARATIGLRRGFLRRSARRAPDRARVCRGDR